MIMASKRKLKNLDTYDDDDEYVPFDPMSEPLFTQPLDNNLDNRRNQDVINLPGSQPLDDAKQDYTCYDKEPDPVADNRQVQDVINLPDSQPLYDSTQDYICCDKEPEPKKEETKDDLKIKTQDNDNKTEKNYSKIQTMEQNATTCVHCIFDKELDRRNYYFGNLLIGELQFLPPCMRSEAYITILRYIDSLKKKHRDDHN